jgi:hypothetical protein
MVKEETKGATISNHLSLTKIGRLRDNFIRATSQEEQSFAGLVTRVEQGTKLVAPTCPFLNKKVKLPEE